MGPIQVIRGIRPIRNVDAGDLLETFLVCGVASILGIRVYLELTGYPQVGGGGLHIAHMLWGGLSMLIAIVLLIAFLGKGVVRFAAVLGGLGFGIFIDELGKFITSDNNYLFKPTFALIYILFVIMFLSFRAIEKRKTLTEEEALVNAVDILKEAVRNDLDDKEKEQALHLLQQSDQSNPIVGALENLLLQAKPLPNKRPSLPVRLARWAHRLYYRIVAYSWFAAVLVAIFVAFNLNGRVDEAKADLTVTRAAQVALQAEVEALEVRVEQVEEIDHRIGELEDRLATLGGDVGNLTNSLDSIEERIRQAIVGED